MSSLPDSYFLFIFFPPQCTISEFPSVSSLTSLLFLPCFHHIFFLPSEGNRGKQSFLLFLPCYFYLVVIEQQHVYQVWNKSTMFCCRFVSICRSTFRKQLDCLLNFWGGHINSNCYGRTIHVWCDWRSTQVVTNLLIFFSWDNQCNSILSLNSQQIDFG